ncbi:uncharacterized protein LOC126769882 isoform X2 [Nymphalis io]|uniref:uncharacterized protein LOC126769882 isoform X2 n=1 Tax=Inachis io TaxID=171585 RepID=UPI002168BE46|nr:uncharacterized protein LOC126769882 isoform X2 [Nymphalis io]
MEVAGQWRREWAGTAEYGKVIEGGVTRQVARAMEVLHASAPGAKVRVMRAAYHSSAGPGAPASSYMMHSSRQVISSGYNFLEPSSLPSKPLEISSTPLESSPDSEVEKENYKVTEPDDYDISEPSKWRGSSRKNSIRMPSEESSSADNASIIDLDSRTSSRSTLRRSFQNKHNEDINRIHNINTRVSPLLDAPVALSTLKYTSLLNGSDDWNNRRKSYSFEGTSPNNKSMSSENNSFTIDSSTDSGICKSSEIVNDQFNSRKNANIFEKMDQNQEETFTEWLSRNRSTSYKDMSPHKPLNIPESQKNEDKITVKSSGKVTITLPIETFKEKQTEISKYDDSDRRTKKVEFCKTELHFAVDTGTVNIIATDEKPPPSNDFRRRRSAFVPLNEKIDKSITLFGEQSKLTENNIHESGISNKEIGETDENTAATKSILKNKIPKPKPYLLGENMAFGNFNDNINNLDAKKILPTTSAVSLINRQLQSERRQSNETTSSCASDLSTVLNNSFRTGSKGPQLRDSSNYRQANNVIIEHLKHRSSDLKNSAESYSQNRLKVRELRGSELAYFGIDDSKKSKGTHSQDNMQEEIFHSVKLVQQISNSVCNSEADSDEGPEYQNISPKYNYSVTPTPKPRSIYSEQLRKGAEPRILKAIIEQDFEKITQSDGDRLNPKEGNDSHKSSHFESDVSLRSTKEKVSREKDVKINLINDYSSLGRSKTASLKRVKNNKENESSKSSGNIKHDKNIPESPLYINLQTKADRKTKISEEKNQRLNDQRRLIGTNNTNSSKSCIKRSTASGDKGDVSDKIKEHRSAVSRNHKNEIKQDTSQHLKKHPRRTEKLTTPDHLQEKFVRQRSYDRNKLNTSISNNKYDSFNANSLKKKENKDSSKLVVDNSSKPKNKEGIENSSTENESKIRNTTKTTNVARPKDTSNENKTSIKSNEENQSLQYALKLSTNKSIKTSSSNTKPDKSSKSKRSKYVINYDDKNGTVSSICKIKSVPGTYTRKLVSVENKSPQECSSDKILNKIALKK